MFLRLDEIGECHLAFKSKVISYGTNKIEQSREGNGGGPTPMNVDSVNGDVDGEYGKDAKTLMVRGVSIAVERQQQRQGKEAQFKAAGACEEGGKKGGSWQGSVKGTDRISATTGSPRRNQAQCWRCGRVGHTAAELRVGVAIGRRRIRNAERSRGRSRRSLNGGEP